MSVLNTANRDHTTSLAFLESIKVKFQPQYFHSVKNNSNKLLICAGDSWTWGDSLGSTLEFPNDEVKDQHRKEHLYGSIISKKINSDFINIAKPGGSNIKIHDMLAVVLEDAVLDNLYNEIHIIICLTENCREASGDPIWVPSNLDNIETIDDFLKSYEQNMFLSFKENFIDKYPDINFYIGRNFTFSYDETILGDNMLDKLWIQCLEINEPYPEDVRFTSDIAVTPLIACLIKLGIYKKLKYSLMEFLARSNLAVDWLENSPLNYKKGTKHPTEKGHEIYANYVYNRIKERLDECIKHNQ